MTEITMVMCTGRGYAIQELAVEKTEGASEDETRAIQFLVSGRRGVQALVVAIADVKGVVTARVAPSQLSKE